MRSSPPVQSACRKQRVTVLVPGNQVGTVEIVEPADDLMALADAAGAATREGGDAA